MCAPSQTAAEVAAACRTAAEANRACPSRRGNVIELSPDNAGDVMIVADLHGNRLNFEKLLRIADLESHPRRHLIMQEVCHGGPEYPGEGGGCMSHLLLEDCIRLKNEHPERFHFLLSNHELAELSDYPICKSRRMLNLVFRAGISEMYGAAAEEVRNAYLEFLSTCPLAVRLTSGVFISHSLPDECDREPFDVSVLQRPLGCADFAAHSPAFKLVWGRDFRAENADAFARQVGADVLIHGHEPCEAGFSAPNKRQVILDGCCSQASYLILPVGPKLTHADVVARVASLHRSACVPGPCTPVPEVV
ncbi:MAG TPA: metallophosphoesterase [Pirellulaceae bacterium]|nr:metallophosphoesterase [Pirellulaceae bacterium]